MYYKDLLEEAFKELQISYAEKDLSYSFDRPLSITIATPQTHFSFKTKTLKLQSTDDLLHMDFDNDFSFETKAPFVSFSPAKNNLLVRLSHTKF